MTGGFPAVLGTEGPLALLTHWCGRLRSGQAPMDASCCSSAEMRRPMYPEDSSRATILGDRPLSGTGLSPEGGGRRDQGGVGRPWAASTTGCSGDGDPEP